MPQLDKVTFLIQFLYLMLVFLLLYFIFDTNLLPTIYESIKIRNRYLSDMLLNTIFDILYFCSLLSIASTKFFNYIKIYLINILLLIFTLKINFNMLIDLNCNIVGKGFIFTEKIINVNKLLIYGYVQNIVKLKN